MYSLTLADQIAAETDKLSTEKLNSLRNLLQGRQTVMHTKSNRITQKGLNSEVVVEKLLANGKMQFCSFKSKSSTNSINFLSFFDYIS